MKDSGGFPVLFAAVAGVALLTGCGVANRPSQAERPPTADIDIVINVEFFDPDESPEVDDSPIQAELAASEPGSSDLGTPIAEIPDMPAEESAPTATDWPDFGGINRIFFAFDSAAIRDGQRPMIRHWRDWLKAHPGWGLRVEGHTDEQGPCLYNLWLGQRRANAARDFLVWQGIDAGRLRAITFGEHRPAIPGASRAEHIKNRRVRAAPMRLADLENYDPDLPPCGSSAMARPAPSTAANLAASSAERTADFVHRS